MSELKEKELSYGALKTVLKNLSLKRREELFWRIPALKKTNSIVPHKLVSVFLSENYMKVNGREWNIGMDEEKGVTSIRFHVEGYFFLHEIQKDPGAAYLALVNNYLKNDTKIEKLVLYSVPEAIKNQNPDSYRLNVKELRLEGPTVFQDALPFIQHNTLKRISIVIRENTLPLLKQPLVKNSETILLQFPYWDPIPLNNLLLNLPNKNVQMTYYRLPIDEVEKLAVSWRNSKRPIQSTFSLTIEEYTYVLDVFDHLQERIGAIPSRIGKLGSVYLSHCVTIPICDNSELVVSGGPQTFRWPPFRWTLRMEVMPRGSTTAK